MGTIEGLRRPRRSEQGAAAVEFALIATILFALLFGIIQFSFWFWAWQAGGHAAREAARVAAVSPCDEAKISAAGEGPLADTPIQGPADAHRLPLTSPAKVGDPVTVEVTFDAVDLHFFPWFNPAITKDATSRIENVPAGGC